MDKYFASYVAIRKKLFDDHLSTMVSAPAADGSWYTFPCSIFNEAWLLDTPHWSRGDNPLMMTGKWLIVLACEFDLGNAAAAQAVQATLTAIGDLFKFKGNHFDGYPLRRDPVTSSSWLRGASNATPVEYSASFLVSEDYASYSFVTNPHDWRSVRVPSHHEWGTWSDAQRNRGSGTTTGYGTSSTATGSRPRTRSSVSRPGCAWYTG